MALVMTPLGYCGPLTNGCCARGCAGMNYPFLTQKERDVETGLDYFLARYYSATQGRFISPDEYTGGPTELFAEVAAHNPTFYAELADPQSLNKYQYALNNPLKFIDPDEAAGFARNMFKIARSEGPYTITSITVPNAFLRGNQWQHIAGEGNAMFLRTMPSGPVKVFNFSPNPNFKF